LNISSAISQHVVLGSTVEVVGGQPQYRGLHGTICNESKNMLWLSSCGTIKGVPKRSNAFLVNGSFFVSGDLLVGRFFDRLVK
jgi:RNase P/RNase MRP subunit p29